ncbi:MAG: endonuclease Q family protein [Candidatus Woesearchaeota archaeon]
MKIFSDLHIHGRYSRATSKELSIENLERYARIKGLNLLGTGDFTHPLWLKELKERLHEDGSGILSTSSGFKFLLQAEVSLMYSQGDKARKIHLVLFAPEFESVERINKWLSTKGRLDYDGRPIFGMSAPEFTERIKDIDERVEIVPAHAWTPWFGIFGSATGFDSVEECFQDQSRHIKMLETGLSSDPEMNWRISKLDKYSLISNSDSHSFWPWRIGRELNVNELKELSYENLIRSFVTRHNFMETIEVDPAYGKYHFDGHRGCRVSMSPQEAMRHKNICPVCGRPLTIGVMHRVEELADRPPGFVPEGAVPFRRIIPLAELISAVLGGGLSSRAVTNTYYSIIKEFGSELEVLLNAEEDKLKRICGRELAEVIMQNRAGKLNVVPGYDGVYGTLNLGNKKVIIGDDEPQSKREGRYTQKGLLEF